MSIQFLYPYFYINYLCFLLLNSRSFLFILDINLLCFTGGSDGKASANAGDAGDVGSIPGLGITPEGENGNPLQHSRLENPMGRGARFPPGSSVTCVTNTL